MLHERHTNVKRSTMYMILYNNNYLMQFTGITRITRRYFFFTQCGLNQRKACMERESYAVRSGLHIVYYRCSRVHLSLIWRIYEELVENAIFMTRIFFPESLHLSKLKDHWAVFDGLRGEGYINFCSDDVRFHYGNFIETVNGY